MHVLNKEEFQLEIEPILHKLFVGNDDTEPFQTQVKERLLLYFPLGGDIERNDYWEIQLFKAIARATGEIGDPGCYLVSSWEADAIITIGGSPKNRFAYIPQPEILEAFATPVGHPSIWSKLNLYYLDFCLCSESGKWGLLTTIDEYAFLGGTSEFMQAVKSYFPEIEQEVDEYLYDLKLEQMDGETIAIQWLKQLLSHVYDFATAEKLLKKAKLL